MKTVFSNPELTLSVIGMAAAFLVNAAVMISVTSRWFGRMDLRLITLEEFRRNFEKEWHELQQQFIEVRTIQKEVLRRLIQIDEKIDKLEDGERQ